jgi:excisionase family DNA binding protein
VDNATAFLELEHPLQTVPPDLAQTTHTVSECASLLGISVCTVRRMIKDGRLPARQVKGPHGLEWRVTLGAMHSVGSAWAEGGQRVHPLQSVQRVDTGEVAQLRAQLSAAAEREADLQQAISWLRARLVHAEEREGEHLATVADLRASVADLVRLLQEERASRRPWAACSLEPTGVTPRRWWAWWRR